MAIDVKLPHLGENIEAGQVVRILVSVGDHIEKNQNVLEVETDKASIEVPAELSGTVKKILVKEGENLPVGGVFLSVESDGVQDAPPPAAAPAPAVAPPAAAAPPPPMPAPTNDGNRDEIAGSERRQSAQPIQSVPSKVVEEVGTAEEVAEVSESRAIVPATPSTRRFAREIGIDIAGVPGSGPGGRILIGDVKKFAKELNLTKLTVDSRFRAPAKAIPNFEKWGKVEIRAAGNIRMKTADHVATSWSMVPHVTQFDKADITDLEKQRKRYAHKAETVGGKLTVTAILVKYIASALKVFPEFNSSIDAGNKQLIFKRYYHIGVAVDTDRGLLVPVIRDVDKKNIIQITTELADLARKARDKKLTLDEMEGGTFTISNLGGIGGCGFTPIVNWPEVAILGVARSQIEPQFVDGEFVPKRMLPLSLSYDHRVIDGADGARFLRWVAEALENPFLISLDG